MAQLLAAGRTGSGVNQAGFWLGNDSYRGAVCPMRCAPGPCVQGRPRAHRPALLHQFSRAAISGRSLTVSRRVPIDGGLSFRRGQLALGEQVGENGRPTRASAALNRLDLYAPGLNPLHLLKHTKDGARLPNEKPLEHFGKAAALESVAAGAGTVSHVMLRNEFAKPEIIASDVTIFRAAP